MFEKMLPTQSFTVSLFDIIHCILKSHLFVSLQQFFFHTKGLQIRNTGNFCLRSRSRENEPVDFVPCDEDSNAVANEEAWEYGVTTLQLKQSKLNMINVMCGKK